MAWDQPGKDAHGHGPQGNPADRHGSTPPPPPAQPPTPPPHPATPQPQPGTSPHVQASSPAPDQPPAPANPLRAIGVALLNLSGLGVGYALTRRWFAMVVCWVATGSLLLAALPADPDGVSGTTLALYAAFLAIAAAHGAARGLRTRLSWPPQAPLAVLIGLVLLAVPAGGVVFYGDAQDEAREQALVDRLDKADALVRTAKNKPFETAKPTLGKALATYRDLDAHHADSRAAKRLPSSLKAYYATVGSPYDQQKYCDAIAPLKYLREDVPDSIGRDHLGSLATWPDNRLATSLYECGVDDLGYDKETDVKNGDLAELLTTFPESTQAAQVEPAISSAIDTLAGGLKGDDPCAANERLRTLRMQADELPGEKAGLAKALSDDADKAGKKVQSGTYACGVDEYKDGDFNGALDTMNDFVDTYKHDKHRAAAKRIAIAAEIAQALPEAGKHLPGSGSGGSVPVTVSNDSPDEIEILYTGPVTGSFTLAPCHGCTTYSSEAGAALSACKDSSKHYPSKTIHLPLGTTYFLHKPTDGSTSAGTDTAELEPNYSYTECAYVVESYGTGYNS